MFSRLAAQRLSVPAFGLLLLALLWTAVLDQDRRFAALREAGYNLELSNYAALLEGHTRNVIRGLDQVVMHLKAEYEDGPARFDLATQVSRSPFLRGLSVQVGIIGPDGILVASTAGTTADGNPIDLSDREHFRVHAERDGGDLFVGKPVLGRASGKWSIQLARRLNRPDGSFDGVMVVSLNPDYLADIYHGIQLGPDSTVVVLGRDGVVRARASGDDRAVGQSFATTPFFDDLWNRGEGFVSGVSPIDGRIRIAAFRRLSDYPLTVLVSRTVESMAATRGEERGLFLLAGWGGTLLIVLGSLILQVQVLRQHATERQLRRSEAELKQAHGELERFTDVLAHHLQEPVRQQFGFAQRLQRLLGDDLPPEAAQALGFILAGAKRQRSLLRDVQLYLSLERLPDHPVPCDLAEIFGQAVAGFADRLPDVELSVDLTGLPPVMMDPRRCLDVARALVDNALTYRRPDVPPKLQVGGTSDGRSVTLRVADNGLGIPSEYRHRVFQVFERLHASHEFPGTGIGLSIAKKIVETNGGALWLDDGIDGGVAVILHMPIRKD